MLNARDNKTMGREMNTRKVIAIASLVTISALVSSCSSMSEIQKVSKSESHFKDAVYEGRDFYIAEENVKGERYRIFHQASTGFSGTSGIRNSATIRAKKFCREMSGDKVMFKESEHTAKPPYVFGNFPRIEIIFACVDRKEKYLQTDSKSDKYDQLKKLKELYDSGALTHEEFQTEKKVILSR